MRCFLTSFAIAISIVGLPVGIPYLQAANAQTISEPSYEHFVGWYELPPIDRKTRKPLDRPGILIPILHRNSGFYTVIRWIEIPLRASENRLVCDIFPSSMKETTIEFDPRDKEYYLVHKSSHAAATDDWYVNGERRKIRKADAPEWISDQTSARPTSQKDIFGRYYFAWFPLLCYEITEEDGEAWLQGFQREADGTWTPLPTEPKRKISPLQDNLGVAIDEKDQTKLAFNKALNRYEITKPGGFVAPLVRKDPLLQPGSKAKDLQTWDKFRIGIPAGDYSTE